MKVKIIKMLDKIINIGITAYLLVILGILPLYHKDGFYMIGDMKYRLFFNTSLYCLPLLLFLLLLVSFIKKQKWILSITDKFVIGYGIVLCISFFVSEYKDIALYGYMDWHMGLLTQLFLIGIYIGVSRGFRWNKLVIWYMCVVSGIIFALGLLNRYAFDPLQMYGGLEYWNKTHLLATIGNINWYAGYFCVVFPIGFFYYWNMENRDKKQDGTVFQLFKRFAAVLNVVAAFGIIMTQGSESGLVAFACIMLFFGFFSFESNSRMQHFLEANVILGLTCLLLKAAYYHWQDRAYFGVDLPSIQIITSRIWIYFTLCAMIIYIIFRYLAEKRKLQIQDCNKIRNSCIILSLLSLLFLITVFKGKVSYLNFNEEWGSGRGLLWPLTWTAFCEMPLVNKLFGVGSDCFAPYMYTYYGSELQGFLKGWWGDAVVANAHNEWLNQLINTGVLGLFTYMGILVTGALTAIKNRKQIPVLLALGMSIVMYSVNNTASFQQVLSTPLLFIVIGMIANQSRIHLPKSRD